MYQISDQIIQQVQRMLLLLLLLLLLFGLKIKTFFPTTGEIKSSIKSFQFVPLSTQKMLHLFCIETYCEYFNHML